MSEIYKTLYVEVFKQKRKAFDAAGANGVANCIFEEVRTGFFWFVERLAITPDPNNTGIATSCYVFDKDSTGLDFSDTVDFTDLLGTQEAAALDCRNPLFIAEGEKLSVRVAGLTPTTDIVYCAAQISVRVPVRILLPDRVDLNRADHRELMGAFTS